VGKAPNGTKGKSGVQAEIHRLVKLRLVDIYRTIDRDYRDRVRQVRRDLQQGLHFQERRALVEEAIRKKIAERISLEKSEHAACGVAVSGDRWSVVLEELKTVVDESMIGFGKDLDIRFFPGRNIPQHQQTIANLNEKAKALGESLRHYAERQVAIARKTETAREAGLRATDHASASATEIPSFAEWITEPRKSFARWIAQLGPVGRIFGVLMLLLVVGVPFSLAHLDAISGWLDSDGREPEIDFNLIRQDPDATLRLYVSNTGSAHAVVERLEVCGSGEYVLKDFTLEDRRWIRSDNPEGEMESFGLIGAWASSRWIASCSETARFPPLLHGSRKIAQDSAEELTFGAVPDLQLSSNVETGQSGGMGFCSLTIHCNNTCASRAVLCRRSGASTSSEATP
jgi:hypothetical protein